MSRAACAVIAFLGAGVVAFSQAGLPAPEGVDLTGNWASAQWSEVGGPGGANDRRSFDYLGIPLNEAGKAWTLSHNERRLSEPERQCGFYTPVYHPFGYGPLNLWREDEFQAGSVLAWVIGGFQDFKPQVMWMDGRPHPGEYEPHRIEGFTTGVWKDDVLVTITTHMTQGLMHRRAPHSDRATLTMRFSRHGDIISLTGRIDDPVYLTRPLYVSKEWTLLGGAPRNRAVPTCDITDEGVAVTQVQRWLPGQNPNLDELTRMWGIPPAAIQGGEETMYPEYRKQLKNTYVRPQKPPRPGD
jgi:hypothetical protein